MRTVLLVMLTYAALTQSLSAAPATAPSNTRFARRDLRVNWADFPPPPLSQTDFLRQTAAELSPQVLGIPGEKIADFFSYNFGRVEGGNLVLTVQVNVPA